MKLHNTLTRKVEEIKPLEAGRIKLYSCGPTVYSYYHIGNLRNAIFNDSLRRALAGNGFEVTQVMNITDVGHLTSDADEGEDKLEKGAASEGKTVWEVAEHYTKAFKRDVAELNVLTPNGYKGGQDSYARATDFIPQQVEIVGRLLEMGFAYQTKQAIYFDTAKLDDYGRLAGQKLSEKEVGARPEVISDPDKHHPQDFALWFFAVGHFKEHSMRWPSPWGEGFPGWHLECSAIIHATLGDPIDIHTGAVDLIGTHHTNEMAQTEAAYDDQLANYWVHNEYVLVEGRKMSKSLGNIYTLADIKHRGYDPLALRLLFLQSHYRSQLNFTWEALDAAQTFLKRMQAWADLKFQTAVAKQADSSQKYQSVAQRLREALADDLNTALALAVLSELSAEAESEGIDGDHFQALLTDIDRLLGLNLSVREDINSETKDILSQRQAARQAHDWEVSDKLRDELLAMKIEIKDMPTGQLWQRL